MTSIHIVCSSRRSRIARAAAALVLVTMVSCGAKDTKDRLSPQVDAPLIVGGVQQIDSLLAVNRGKWVLVNVWATWCRPCVAEVPELVNLHRSLQAKPFVLLGVSMDYMTSPTEAEAIKKVRTFATQYQTAYPHLVYSGSVDDLAARFSLRGAIPESILYDPRGNEIERWVGQLVDEDFARIRARVS